MATHTVNLTYFKPGGKYYGEGTFEVPDGTGHTGTRTADAIAMSMWPSRGLEVIGMEIKVSRGDWLRELKNPAKAEAMAKFCDRWYLVVSDAAIVKEGELPATWGLMVPRGAGLVVKVEAKPHERDHKTLPRKFVAAMLRKAFEQAPVEAELKAIRQANIEIGYARAKADAAHEASRANRDHEELRKTVLDFEAAAGIKIGNRWDGGDVGAALALLRSVGIDRMEKRLEGLIENARRFADDGEKAIARLTEAQENPPEPEQRRSIAAGPITWRQDV